jgi:aldose 1-epimerase
MDLSPGSLLALRCGELELELAPAIGGSIARFYSVRDGVRHDWLRPASARAIDDGDPTGMASFPLVPFCNRIRDGRFRFSGRDIALPPNVPPAPHAIHGTGWQLPWTVLAHDQHSALLELDYRAGDWPWHFRATQRVELASDGLTLTMEVQNLDRLPMPIGMGFHPYVAHRRTARVTVSASAMWDSDDELLPTALARPPVLASLRAGVMADELLLDNNFIGWDRVARVDFTAADGLAQNRSMLMSATSPLEFVVIYAPPGQDYFCIEPVSNCTDWPNLTGHASEQTGGAVLAPGEVCRASMRLRTQWDQ